MEIVKKNVAMRVEFGDYNNWAILVPEALKLTKMADKIYAIITYNYGLNDKRTIDLCEHEIVNIDFNSFSTTFEKELKKLGYKSSEVQFHKNKLYIIKDKNGKIVPFEKYLVTYDYTEYGYTEEYSIKCETRGPDCAINYAKACTKFPALMQNIRVKKI